MFFSGGGGGGGALFLGSHRGVCRPALLIFTLFQGNIYKANVRDPPRFYVVKKNYK